MPDRELQIDHIVIFEAELIRRLLAKAPLIKPQGSLREPSQLVPMAMSLGLDQQRVVVVVTGQGRFGMWCAVD